MLRSPRVLAAARVLAGLTQSELAAAAGVAVGALQALEQGRSDPKLSTLLALVDALRAHGVELLSEDGRTAGGAVLLKGSEAERSAPRLAAERGTDAAPPGGSHADPT